MGYGGGPLFSTCPRVCPTWFVTPLLLTRPAAMNGKCRAVHRSIRDKARYTLAIKSTVPKTGDKVDCRLCCRFVADIRPISTLSPILSTLSPIYRPFVESRLSPTRLSTVSRSTLSPKLNMFNSLGRICRKWVIFIVRMSNVLSTLSPVHMYCVPGLTPTRNTFNGDRSQSADATKAVPLISVYVWPVV